MPTQRFGMGQEAHSKVWDGSGRFREANPKVQRPTRKSGRGREAHPEVW